MARRKSRKKTTHRRSRRISGFGGDLQILLAATAGAVGGKILQSKLAATMNPKIIAGASAAVGLFLAKNSNPMLKGVGIGLFTAGGTGLAQSFNLISGIGAPPITFVRDSTPLINGAGMGAGYPEMNVVSGINGLYDDFS